ncbi:hypothetical protein LCGC14_2367570 [marine sediment metagenome]|uniref:Uncharacterized protein n=1 Tax=marine sediment metagenome TaxID=412755 RepID=A0A0F9CS17_9ZZZZ
MTIDEARRLRDVLTQLCYALKGIPGITLKIEEWTWATKIEISVKKKEVS